MPIIEIDRRSRLSRNACVNFLPVVSYSRPKFPSKRDEYEQSPTSGLHGETKRPCKQRLTTMHLHQDVVQTVGHNWMHSNRH